MELEDLSLIDIDDLKTGYINSGTLICSLNNGERFPNILPVTYVKDSTFHGFNSIDLEIAYGAKFKETRDSVDLTFQQLDDRFSENELFYLIKFDENHNQFGEKYFAFGNETKKLDNNIIEIYEGEFTPNNVYFTPTSPEIFALIESKLEKGERQYFYIKNNQSIYGPFNPIEIEADKIKVSAILRNGDIIFCWDSNIIESKYSLSFTTNTNNSKELYRVITNDWLPDDKSKNRIRFFSDDRLILWFKSKISELEKYSKHDFVTFQNIFQDVLKSNSNSDEEILYSRCESLFNIANTNRKQLEDFVEILPTTKVIQQQIEDKEATKNKLTYEIDQLNSKSENISDDIQLNEQQFKELSNKLIDLKSEIEQITSTQIEEAKQNNTELKSLLLEKDSLKLELSKLKHYEKVKDLETQVENLRADKRSLERDESDLTNSIKALSQEFISNQKEAHEKLNALVTSKIHYDFISGREFNEKDESNNITQNKLINPITSFFDRNIDNSEIVSHERLLINEISKILRLYGRNYTPDFIANILICFFQNTATIFAGAPGSGKTSLSRLITSILTTDITKTVEIPVAKGWTTQKDLIGFFNPLSKQFVPANEKFYNLIKNIEIESKEDTFFDSNIGFVILDEANLSPIEHYWSCFYNLTDSFASRKKMLSLELGVGHQIKYANNLRFIGTINTDQTTEELSPRFIDRTNIIKLSTDVEFTSHNTYSCENNTPTIDLLYRDILKMFNLKDFGNNTQINDFEKESFKALRDDYKIIKDSFRNLNIFVSPRIDISFAEYAVTASKFMSSDKALDYFVSQRLLTKIDGQGQQFGESLNDLRDICDKIFSNTRIDSITLKILDEIVRIGQKDEHFQNYNYFLLN